MLDRLARMLRWGATDDELRLPLPGDELLTTTDLVSTRAVALGVAQVEPERVLVLGGGVQMGTVPAPYDFTLAFVLENLPDGSSRLLVRERYAYKRVWAALVVEPTEVISFVMTQRMLRGIRDCAERSSSASQAMAHVRRQRADSA